MAIHRLAYTRLGGDRASLYLLVVVNKENAYQDAEKVRQRRSRVAQRLSVPNEILGDRKH
jgi:hypothetical protein